MNRSWYKLFCIQIFVCFSLPWTLFFILLTTIKIFYYSWGQGNYLQMLYDFIQKNKIWCNLLISLCAFVIGLLIHFIISSNVKLKNMLFSVIIVIFILIVLDWSIRILVLQFLKLDAPLSFLNGWIEISRKPLDSNFASMGSISKNIRLFGYIPFVIIMYFFLRGCYFYLSDLAYILTITIFWVSGYAASIIYTIVFDPIYDYINISGIIACDIKDIYLYIGTAVFFQMIMRNYARICKVKKISGEHILRYFKWEYRSWRSVLSKFTTTTGRQ